MDIDLRLKVTTDLCYDAVRNAAYYRSGFSSTNELKKRNIDFWVNLNGNFLDVAVLSWCYLFGDKKAEFRWQNLINDQHKFMNKMCEELQVSTEDYDSYILSMRDYRDKFVAHRDRYLSGSPIIRYPDLEIAINTTCFFFNELHEIYPVMSELVAHKDLKKFYIESLNHGNEQHYA